MKKLSDISANIKGKVSAKPKTEKVKAEKIKPEKIKPEKVKTEKVKPEKIKPEKTNTKKTNTKKANTNAKMYGKGKVKNAKVSIGLQILLAFFIPVIFVILVGLQSYKSASEGLSRKFEESTSETLKMTVEYVGLGGEFISVEAMQYAFNENLQKYYLGLYKTDPIKMINAMNEGNSLITTTKMTNSFVNNIHIITRSGVSLLTTTSENSDGFYEELEKQFKEQYSTGRVPNWLDNHTLIDEKLSLNPEETLLSYVVQGNNNSCYVVIDMSRNKIQELMDALDLGDGSIVGMVTAGGKECLSGTEETALFTTLDCYAESMQSEETSGMIETEYNGESYLYLYSREAEGVFSICALVPTSTVTGQAATIKSVTITMVLLASIVAVIIGMGISIRMVGSMRKMMKSMKNVAGGDLTVSVREKGLDEFALLAGSMNNMVSNTKKLVLKVADAILRMDDSTKEVSKTSEVINEYSENITGAINEIHEGMNIQAENAQECLQKTDALSQEIQLISQRIDEIEHNVVDTGNKINAGMKIMQKLGDSAVQTSGMTTKVSDSITLLQEEFEQIKGFVDTINSISEETNLLSLNASIEAARAGEAGRGFAVVADQIRKLADGSAQAAAEIQKTVEMIRQQTDTSVDNANQAKEMVDQQTQAVEEVQVSFRSMQQDMNNVVGRMKEITQNTEQADQARVATLQAIENISAVIEETAAASAVVNETAEKLLSHVGMLRDTADVMDENMVSLKSGIQVFKTE